MSQTNITPTITSAGLKLTPEEEFIIKMLRGKAFQELTIKVQDGVIVFLERTEKFTRSKGGLI